MWNLRLVKMDEELEVREVYYDELGKPIGHTPAVVAGEDKQEIAEYLEWMVLALKKPVLEFKRKELTN
jgi:hypothetical protein